METDARPAPAGTMPIVPFDPYAAALPLRWLRKLPTVYLLLLAPVVAGLLIVGATAGGMLGGARDFQPLQDIRLAIGQRSLDPSALFTYPLTRDLPVWIFAIIMVVQILILHRQWELFSRSLPRLAKNRVLALNIHDAHDSLQDVPTLGWLAEVPEERRLATYVSEINARNESMAGIYTVVFSMIALVLAALLIWAEYSRVFRVFTPKVITPAAMANWRLAAYHHWWASINHPVGVTIYFVLVALSIYVILAQTQVGVSASRLASALPRLAKVDANWVNPDGNYGWGPVHKIFNLVWSQMALYGLMVSVLAVVLGLGGIGWIPALIWGVLVTIYFAIPWFAFREIESRAKERHIDAAQTEAGAMTTKAQDELEVRVKRYRTSHINPMRLRLSSRIPIVLSVLLPMVLNLLQPLIQSALAK